MSTETTQPWEWRKPSGGWTLPSDRPARRFHAFDVNNLAACAPSFGLIASCEPPNEGSLLCADCVEVVRDQPAGRDLRSAVRAADGGV